MLGPFVPTTSVKYKPGAAAATYQQVGVATFEEANGTILRQSKDLDGFFESRIMALSRFQACCYLCVLTAMSGAKAICRSV